MTKMFNKLLNIIFPASCLLCKTDILENGNLCSPCWGGIRFISSPKCAKCGFPFEYEISQEALCAACVKKEPIYEQACSIMIYDVKSSKLVTDLKYRDHTVSVNILSKWMVNNIPDKWEIDCVIPVPIHKKRLLQRKYNQSALLGKQVAKILAKKFNPQILQRIKNTPPQASLDFIHRRSNVTNCFRVNKKYNEQIKKKNILLIDDVITTGATIEQCCKQLKRAGVNKIYVLTIAKTLKG